MLDTGNDLRKFASDYLATLGASIGPLIVTAVVLSVFLSFLFAKSNQTKMSIVFWFVSPFAWLGAISGFIAGSSQEPLVSALLAGILTLSGTLTTYLIGKETEAISKKMLPPAMMLLFLCALVGLTTGAANKVRWDDFDREYAKWQLDYEEITVPARAILQRHQVCVTNSSEENKEKCDELLRLSPS